MSAVIVSDEGKAAEYEMVPKKEQSVRLSPDIEWVNLNMKVQNGAKSILSDCWGQVKSGTVCGLLGASGAGKSSLLNILSGRQTAGGGVDIEGKITVGGKVINPVAFRKNIAYVMQDDALMATTTPREALRFSAVLRLPQTTPISEIHDLVERLIEELGIKECADTYIGNHLIKGISGGQRKRTSIGIELITNPVLLFLDEPTSGLDSHTSCQLLLFLKKMALRDCTILCTLHQPSSEIFFMFDNVIFMKAGRIFYQGPVTNIVKHFAALGYQCPELHNPADYVMNVLQITTVEECEEKNIFMHCPHELLEKGGSVKWNAEEINFTVVSSFRRQFSMLTYREYKNTIRDKASLIARFGITIFLNLIFGLIFLDAGRGNNANDADIQAHFGAMTMVLISAMFGAANPVALAFPSERPMFLREYSSSTYGAPSYFLSKLVVEAPLTFCQTLAAFCLTYNMIGMRGNFIWIVLPAWALSMASCSVAICMGCLVSNVKQIMEATPVVFVPQLLFCGFFIRTSLIPIFLRWAQYLCSIKYAMNLVLMTEFRETSHSCNTSPAARANCHSIIKSNDIEPDKFYIYIIILFVLFAGFRLAGMVLLIRKAKKFY